MFNPLNFVTSVRDDERDKQNRLVNLHDEFRALLDIGASDDDEEEEDGAGEDAEVDKQAQVPLTEDSRMVVDSTALPSDIGGKVSRQSKVSEAVIKKGAHRYQVQVSDRDIEKIKKDCQNRNLPLIEEFDFRKDIKTPDLKIELKSTTQIRHY